MFAVALLACVLGLADLALIAVLARRIRAVGPLVSGPPARPWLPAGARAGNFSTTSVSGERVARDTLIGRPSLVAFFATDCEACHEQVPAFAAYASRQNDAAHTVAVVVGRGADGSGLVDALGSGATVVREQQRGALAEAFSNFAFPSVYLLDPEGFVIARGPSVLAVASRIHP